MEPQSIIDFKQLVWDYFKAHGRHDLPWRIPEDDGTLDPYKIMVSEIMLQQTQASRVIPKYHLFLKHFPNAQSLAKATLGQVLITWSSLGYNRRAKFLWQAAKLINASGKFPEKIDDLIQLPGVGINTAGAIVVYAYNKPAIFVETNIRTVYIHHFFNDQPAVTDKEIISLLTQTLDTRRPREFYWALMDYGAFLKATAGNFNRQSQHYTKQSPFVGSNRSVRGAVIRLLSSRPYSSQELHQVIKDSRLEAVLADLVAEDLIQKTTKQYSL